MRIAGLSEKGVCKFRKKRTVSQRIKIYELLNEQLRHPEKARALTETVEAILSGKVQQEQQVFELAIKKDLELLRTDLRSEMRETASVLRTEMREQKVDLIKWFVGLFMALALMIIGLYVKR